MDKEGHKDVMEEKCEDGNHFKAVQESNLVPTVTDVNDLIRSLTPPSKIFSKDAVFNHVSIVQSEA